jgi:major membrane immunogen (membrane-anchored lipoprotein)
MKKILILFISIVALFSCSKDDENKLSGLNIRLSNVSQYDFKNIVVNTTTGNVNFENLNSGQKSEYKEFDKAYSYAFVELEIDEGTYTIQPIDYVGETLLDNGNYTYQLDANDSNDQYTRLSLTLIED